MKIIPRFRGALPVVTLVAASVLLGACTVLPVGPSVMAIPGSSKSVENYQADVADCQQYAGSVIAASGAGFGMLFGGASGSAYTSMSSYQLQRGYDSVYLNCMYARGHRVPVPRSYARGPSRPVYSDSGATSPAYPPPNTPPPPALSGSGYLPPANVPPSSYPPPNTPPPELPPRR